MKVVLLAGGKGTRISEESVTRPKPMVGIGGMPILWHIMKEYSHFGFNEFIVCAGYKQDYIKQWFNDYFVSQSDVTFDFTDFSGGGGYKIVTHESHVEPWKVTVVDTGAETMTGGRVRRVQKYVGDEPFMLTYGDAVCDVDISKLVEFHKSHGKLATITAVIQKQEKGVLDISEIGYVRSFREKAVTDGTPINAGYMVLQPEVFNYLHEDSDVFEKAALEQLSKDGQLMSYRHEGFWQCMDSIREKQILQAYWDKGNAPWKSWE